MDILPLLYYLKYFILLVAYKSLQSGFFIYIFFFLERENIFLMHKKYRRLTFAGYREYCHCLGMEKNQFTWTSRKQLLFRSVTQLLVWKNFLFSLSLGSLQSWWVQRTEQLCREVAAVLGLLAKHGCLQCHRLFLGREIAGTIKTGKHNFHISKSVLSDMRWFLSKGSAFTFGQLLKVCV